MKQDEKTVVYTYGDRRILRFDEYNYTIEKYAQKHKIEHGKKETTGKTWKLVGYFATFEAACKYLRNDLVDKKMNIDAMQILVDMFEKDITDGKGAIIDVLHKRIEFLSKQLAVALGLKKRGKK